MLAILLLGALDIMFSVLSRYSTISVSRCVSWCEIGARPGFLPFGRRREEDGYCRLTTLGNIRDPALRHTGSRISTNLVNSEFVRGSTFTL